MSGADEQRVTIGPVVVAYRGAAATALLHRFAEAPAGAPTDLRIDLRPGASPSAPPGAVLIPSFHQGELQAFVAGGRMILRDGAAEIVVDETGSRIEGTLADGDDREPSFFVERTLFAAVLVALRHHGLFHIHGGAVLDRGGRGLFVVGSGGAGKSTTTLSLLRGGGGYLGDDAVLVTAWAGEARLLAFPKAFHVGARTITAFPEVAPFVGEPYRAFSDKRAFEPRDAFPGRAVAAMKLPRVLLFPRVTAEARTAITALPAAEAHYRLVESSAFVLADGMARRAEHLALLTRLVEAKAFEVALGEDALQDPGALGERLRALAAG